MPHSRRPPPQTIYVVDDEPDMREIVNAALTAEGYQVVEASDGQELLDGLIERARLGTRADLVVSDVAMPRLTGPGACAAARAAGVDTPFIFMTAFASAGGREAVMAAGAAAVLDKPFAMEELLAAVREQLLACGAG